MCPDCKHTLLDSFSPAIDNGLLEMADVNFNIAGNAKVDTDSTGARTFTCQHGETECATNLMETCFQLSAPDHLTALKSVMCVFEDLPSNSKNLGVNRCADKYNLPFGPIFKCIVQGEGEQLFYDAIQRTPAHTFIPWAVVDGKELTQSDRDMINNDVLKWACENYGGKKPESCNKMKIALSII